MKPMLAVECDLDKLSYPVYIDRKLDGIRCIVKDGQLLSRSLKPIRNEYTQSLFSHLEGCDGELIVGDPTATDVFQVTTSGVMSKNGEPDVYFHVFDIWNQPDKPYRERLEITKAIVQGSERTLLTEPLLCYTEDVLMEVHALNIEDGFEGSMTRHPESGYKYGRSTQKSQHLLKLKEFEDNEFVVVGFKERMHNTNEMTRNALGYAERSSHKDGKKGMGTLGSLVLQYGDDTFDCGTGFDDRTRQHIWDNREEFIGKLAKVKYQPSGAKDKPRFPVFCDFIGFRDEEDL